jgi:hypothetical protein
MRRLIYDIATAPFLDFLIYEENFAVFFYQCVDAHLVDEEPVDAVLALELVDLKDALLSAVRPVHHPFEHSQPAH